MKWEGKDSKESIVHVKFSSNSQMFALVDSDNKVYIYDNKDRCDSYKPKLRVLTSLHKATIHSLDFSNDSYFVQTSSADYEHIRCE
jgi:WD40 repeat protein